MVQRMPAGPTDCERGGKGGEWVREGCAEWRSACLRYLLSAKGEVREVREGCAEWRCACLRYLLSARGEARERRRMRAVLQAQCVHVGLTDCERGGDGKDGR